MDQRRAVAVSDFADEPPLQHSELELQSADYWDQRHNTRCCYF